MESLMAQNAELSAEINRLRSFTEEHAAGKQYMKELEAEVSQLNVCLIRYFLIFYNYYTCCNSLFILFFIFIVLVLVVLLYVLLYRRSFKRFNFYFLIFFKIAIILRS